MKMNRNVVQRLTIPDDDDGYVQADMADRISAVWEITKDAWSFIRVEDAQRRLQRNVAAVIRGAG